MCYLAGAKKEEPIICGLAAAKTRGLLGKPSGAAGVPRVPHVPHEEVKAVIGGGPANEAGKQKDRGPPKVRGRLDRSLSGKTRGLQGFKNPAARRV